MLGDSVLTDQEGMWTQGARIVTAARTLGLTWIADIVLACQIDGTSQMSHKGDLYSAHANTIAAAQLAHAVQFAEWPTLLLAPVFVKARKDYPSLAGQSEMQQRLR